MILRNFRKRIEDIINQSGLSIDAVYFVIKDIYTEVTGIYSNEIQKEDAKIAEKAIAASENAKEEDSSEVKKD